MSCRWCCAVLGWFCPEVFSDLSRQSLDGVRKVRNLLSLQSISFFPTLTACICGSKAPARYIVQGLTVYTTGTRITQLLQHPLRRGILVVLSTANLDLGNLMNQP